MLIKRSPFLIEKELPVLSLIAILDLSYSIIHNASLVFIHLVADVLSFQNFFKIWLLDGSTDQDHLRITLPSAFTQDSEGETNGNHQ